jgi:hypothetical protein
VFPYPSSCFAFLGPPRCFFINEIGQICASEDTSSKEAERALVRLLGRGDIEDRPYVFTWLSMTSNVDRETSSALNEFRQDPANKQVVEMAEAAISCYKASH